MKKKFTKPFASVSFIIILILACCITANAQWVEKLIIYENFGGTGAGTSVPGIQPVKWPDVNSGHVKDYCKAATCDSMAQGRCRWSASMQNIDNKNDTVRVPQFNNNSFFHIDSLIKYRDGGLAGLDITVNNVAKTWSKTVSLLNGYKLPVTNTSTASFRFLGCAVLPDFMSWISYADYSYLKNQTDEKGYIYFGKNFDLLDSKGAKVSTRPIMTIPGGDIEFLKDISKVEMLISGSRVGHLNTLSVEIEEISEEGVKLGITTYTYSVSIQPRLITVPVDKAYCRISIQAWGSSNNSNTTDFALLTSNTEVDTRVLYNYNAIACTKPDGSASSGQTTNPGIQLHMLKVYAKMEGAGYTITTDNALVSGTKTGITHGQTITLTAQATNGSGKKFMGWKIKGTPDLSEVVNPLNIKIICDTTVMPVYAGDEAELAVVNENFTNWTQHGQTDVLKNNQLIYANTPTASQDTISTVVKVPLRHGFISGGKDSVEITLKKCNVIPSYGLRVYNMPGWEKYIGYIAFMGPNASKGYVSVGPLDGITKAEVDISSYDLPVPDRACMIKVNGTTVRNKMLSTLYPENVVITNNPTTNFNLQVGPGSQARCEYINPPSAAANVESSGFNAAAVALHNLKMYAKVTVPDKNYFKLNFISSTGGYITGCMPQSGNSTNHYMEGTKVTIGAESAIGYGFDHWEDGSGNSLGNSKSIAITMDAEKTLKPVFSQYPSYIKVVDNPKGSITTNIKPIKISNDTLTFLAGVSVIFTATPNYGFKVNTWTIGTKDTLAGSSTLTVPANRMHKNNTKVIAIKYDSITTRQTLVILNDTTMGKVTFDHAPEKVNAIGDTVKFPTGVTITATAEPAYGKGFTKWTKGFSVADNDSAKNPITLVMSAERKIATNWKTLARKTLVIESSLNGTVVITDSHKDGEQEKQGLWPVGYQVQLTARPASGYALASIGQTASWMPVNDTVILVTIDTAQVTTVSPEFVIRQSGVVLAINENFQDGTKWPENEGTVSNVPGAIEFLGLDANWNPKTYNANLEGLLTILAPYRTWGSQSNDNSDGPNGTKNPRTTLSLVYKKTPYVNKLRIGTSSDSVKITLVNFAPCNNCLIGKAVKLASISNRYLGHVTPGMIALKKPNVTGRASADYPAFMPDDSVGMMIINGLAYVEKLEIGYVSSGSQFCPGVFYITNPDAVIMKSTGLFGANFADLWPLGQVTRISDSPYQNKYGWGSAQEGMIMDQNMYVAEEELAETRLLITAGYKKETNFSYSDIYIHDLKVWGSPMVNTGIKDLISKVNNTDSKFYMLGNTEILKLDIDEPAKALVIYNVNGSAVKIMRNVNSNQVNLSGLKTGYYGVHAYGKSGKLYSGAFVKLNN